MITRHFFKILFIFIGMIALGLVGVYAINHSEQGEQINTPNTADIAK